MSDNLSPRPRPSSWRYGSVVLNVITLCCCVCTVWLGGYYALLLVNPYSLNPFPPPSDPTRIVMATITPTSVFDFPSFTPTLAPTFTGTPTLPPPTATRGVTATTLAALTPSPTVSSLPLQTATATRTGSVVPSPTRQGGATSSITSTPAGGATATTTRGTAGPTSAPNTSIAGGIWFVSNRNGADGIFMAHGTTIQTVLSDGFTNQRMMLSPDNRRLVNSSNKDGDEEIYTLDLLVGDGWKKLTTNTKSDIDPVWSPNSKQIAYATNASGTYDIWIMNFDGTGATQITFSPKDDRAPTWSNDGKKLAFQTNRDGTWQIYVIDLASKVETRIISNSANTQNPNWSPTKNVIAYDSDQEGNAELYMINSDGSSEQRLTNNSAADSNPWWSSDGAKVAFQSTRNGNLDIFMMDGFSGANAILLLTGSSDEKMPTWSK